MSFQYFYQYFYQAVPKLTTALWGEFYLNPKTKVISSKPPNSSTKPMIIQLILEQLWKVSWSIYFWFWTSFISRESQMPYFQIYDCTIHKYNEAMITKIVQGLNIGSLIDSSESLKEGSTAVKAIMSSWLPLSSNLLVSCYLYLHHNPIITIMIFFDVSLIFIFFDFYEFVNISVWTYMIPLIIITWTIYIYQMNIDHLLFRVL